MKAIQSSGPSNIHISAVSVFPQLEAGKGEQVYPLGGETQAVQGLLAYHSREAIILVVTSKDQVIPVQKLINEMRLPFPVIEGKPSHTIEQLLDRVGQNYP